MTSRYKLCKKNLKESPKKWLITGVAGFIGSNLLECLLKLNQQVIGLDNFCTGYQANLDDVRSLVSSAQWSNFKFYEGDIRDIDDCMIACHGVDYVLHQAALGSVPRSIENPIITNQANIDGFLNMLVAARDANVSQFVYAASSSTYGDHPDLPKQEGRIGKPLSPYAVTKLVNELYAQVFASTYGFQSVGLRYFNVFGERQNPNGAYAAVIPRWIHSMLNQEEICINGDGDTSRDFTYVENIVQLNLLAATNLNAAANNQIFNGAASGQTSLRQLHERLSHLIVAKDPKIRIHKPLYREFRAGDVRHSLADISKAMNLLGYAPTHQVVDGLTASVDWYLKRHHKCMALPVKDK